MSKVCQIIYFWLENDRFRTALCTCRSILAKPTGKKKENDIPGLPETSKKLYQNFKLFYFRLFNNVAFIDQRFYM